jgi:hypothetical protein
MTMGERLGLLSMEDFARDALHVLVVLVALY